MEEDQLREEPEATTAERMEGGEGRGSEDEGNTAGREVGSEDGAKGIVTAGGEAGKGKLMQGKGDAVSARARMGTGWGRAARGEDTQEGV